MEEPRDPCLDCPIVLAAARLLTEAQRERESHRRKLDYAANPLGRRELAALQLVAKGYTALKTNVFVLDEQPYLHSPGFARNLGRGGYPELNADRHVLNALRDQLAAWRESLVTTLLVSGEPAALRVLAEVI